MDDRDEALLRVVIVATLGLVLVAAIIGMTVVAVTTDRDLRRAETLTFGGVVLLAALGGVSWWQLRKRWRIRFERNGDQPEPMAGPPREQDTPPQPPD